MLRKISISIINTFIWCHVNKMICAINSRGMKPLLMSLSGFVSSISFVSINIFGTTGFSYSAVPFTSVFSSHFSSVSSGECLISSGIHPVICDQIFKGKLIVDIILNMLDCLPLKSGKWLSVYHLWQNLAFSYFKLNKFFI